MTALAAHRSEHALKARNMQNKRIGSALIETSAAVFVGSLLVADATTGLSKVAADAGAGATVFLGICTGFKNLSAALTTSAVVGDGVIEAEWATGHEVLVPCAASVTAADTGKALYCLDDEGVTDATTAGPGCGKMIELESTLTVWVELSGIALPLAT